MRFAPGAAERGSWHMNVACAPTPSYASPDIRQWSVVRVRDPKELASHVPAWEELCAHLAEPNVFYEPWMLLPAIECLGSACPLEFVLIFAQEPNRPSTAARLMGL